MNKVTKPNNSIVPSTEEIKEYALSYLETKLSNLNEQQKKEFISMCAIHKLNPFKREIHALVYGTQMQIVVGYEVYLKRAAASGLLDGYTIDLDKSDPKNPIAIATIYRKGWKYPIVHKVVYSEYVQRTNGGSPTKLWTEKPRTMLEKVAISQGFRRAFPDIIEGFPYISEEVPAAQTYEEPTSVSQQATPNLKVIKNEAKSQVTNTNLEEAEELFA